MRKPADHERRRTSNADDEAAGRTAQTSAIKQALAHEGRVDAQVRGSVASGLPAPLWIAVAVSVAAILAWVAVS